MGTNIFVSFFCYFYTYIELILIFLLYEINIVFYFHINEMMLVAKLANKIPSI